MGQLFYGNTSESIEVPDRLLAHLKVLAATKLRRSESFTLTWRHGADIAAGRQTIWLQPSIPLRFVFDGLEAEKLDSALLTEMARAATSSTGLVVDFADFDVAPALPVASALPASGDIAPVPGELATAA
ncbi:hypothetical protein A9Z40_14645 [Microbacterium arborescens]|uniref:DUF7882 domain-containing protein n=1 Tax=Microbacterium arborescens TaxID=33883 RepID=A0ABX2WKC4_9MICO|nr:hypothetical protein [Microbacterium arborescens]OAZ43088.1 hypothetical protein A9Z40_14645 [Microbacterium arborescens]